MEVQFIELLKNLILGVAEILLNELFSNVF